MRAALISMAGQPRDAARAAPLELAGKTIARRQLDFALAAGCESVIALGDGGSPEAIALRHAAEASGARFQAVRDSHGLLGAVRTNDELLALAPGLLPDAAAALELLGKGKAVLVLPAGAGVAAGFERIDLDRAWAGALIVGGTHVERLSDLPSDIEPSSALMRIALQGRVSERGLPVELLADGSWSMLDDASRAAEGERSWLKRHLPDARPWSVSQWIATLALRLLAGRLLAVRRSTEAFMLGAFMVLTAAVVLAWCGLAEVGLALVALGAIVAQTVACLTSLRRAPFGVTPRVSMARILPCLADATLIACAVLAIDGAWPHRLFPPLVLLGALLALRGASGPAWLALPRDRAVVAAILPVAAAMGRAELATMVVSLMLIALNVAYPAARRG